MEDVDKNLIEEVQNILSKYGDILVTTIRDQISQKDKIASGDMYNSVQFQVVTQDCIIQLQILANDYIKWVNLGRLPGTPPPISNIIKWVEIRGLKNRRAASSKSVSDNDQKRLAYAIQHSIGNIGIKAVPVISDSVNMIQDQLKIDVGTAIAKATTSAIGKDLLQMVNEIADSRIQINIS